MTLAIPEFAAEIDAVADILRTNRDELGSLVAEWEGNPDHVHVDLATDRSHVQALTQAVDYLKHYGDGYR